MNSDSDLEKNEKYMYFKDQLKDMKKQCKSYFFKRLVLNGDICSKCLNIYICQLWLMLR